MKNIALFALVMLGSCDYSGDFLFAESGLIDDIWILTAEDGGQIVPAVIEDIDQLRAATIYAEVGAPATTAYGGVTFDFLGTGGDVCVWVDPEIAYWSNSVAVRPGTFADKWTYPDNVFDDGDLDLFVGLSVYYTGSPGEEIGDFVVQYEDSLGNDIPIELALCPNLEGLIGEPATGGRGSPEYCSIPDTSLGIGYTVLLRTWSTPLDDDRLAFGVVIAEGDCQDLIDVGYPGGGLGDECVIQGEAIMPQGESYGPFYGFDAVSDKVWPGSTEFEAAYCDPEQRMQRFCKDEVDALAESGEQCSWGDAPSTETRCYCGDPNDTPDGGAG